MAPRNTHAKVSSNETHLTQNAILSELAKSPHGRLTEYVPTGKRAAAEQSEFFAHMIAWNQQKGAVRDSKVALPVVSLGVPQFTATPEFLENSFAHLARLGPRELERAYRFALTIKIPGQMRRFRNLVSLYLRVRENMPWEQWERMAVQHRATLANLYALVHVKPEDKRKNDVLFKGVNPPNSTFDVISRLKHMTPEEAAGEIASRKIPFLIAQGALQDKMKSTDLVLALINRMSPTELVTNTKMLEKLGVKTQPALKAAFEAAIAKAAKSKKNTLKTTRAAEAISDEGLKAKLIGLQEKQLSLMGVEGNWLILADKSGSMEQAIEMAKLVAAVLAKLGKGTVTLVFFDTVASRVFNVTGQEFGQIKMDTKHVVSGGGTSIGCGLQYAIDRNVEADGIAIISDAQENSAPRFADTYTKYCAKIGKEIPVYLYRCEIGTQGYADVDLAKSMAAAHIDLQEFDLRGKGIDYYSVVELAKGMRTNRYSLIEEIMNVPLLTTHDVFAKFDVQKAVEEEIEREEVITNA